MEAQTRDDDGRMHAPGEYVVFVNPADFERLASIASTSSANGPSCSTTWPRASASSSEGDARRDDGASAGVPVGAIDVEPAGLATPVDFACIRRRRIAGWGILDRGHGAYRARRASATFVLTDPSVSRAHAVVEIGGADARVRDLGSTNGTFVNGRRIESGTLRDGDELRFGNTQDAVRGAMTALAA